ncbi:hypothetical protein C5748_22425 [Phyllobacterium phragmitis]|uniref:Uncharacterized protein n=1 Tax=Phyllobacterium phragmitis TaxID=2670329 RepID=A0A2S9IL56_9HYPH|nr:hypothetical protein C5748_22425 [Phyllobacterium phragmitis]
MALEFWARLIAISTESRVCRTSIPGTAHLGARQHGLLLHLPEPDSFIRFFFLSFSTSLEPSST